MYNQNVRDKKAHDHDTLKVIWLLQKMSVEKQWFWQKAQKQTVSDGYAGWDEWGGDKMIWMVWWIRVDDSPAELGVFIRWNGMVEWNGGMERWNGIVEW